MESDYKPEQINEALASHQKAASSWKYSSLSDDLHAWTGRFKQEFKLGEGIPALAIEPLRHPVLGHYRPGRNGLGLQDEIAIDVRHARTSPYFDVLGTLLHELLHQW